MPPLTRELTYRVSVSGQAGFRAELRGLMDEVRRQAGTEMEIARSVARGRQRASTEAAEHARALLRANLAFERARARESVRNAEQAERDKRRAAEREGHARERASIEAGRRIVRVLDREVREFERAEREKTRIALREGREREREAERASRQALRDAERRARDEAFDRKRFLRGIATGFVEGGIGAFRLVGGVATRGARGIAGGLGLNQTFDAGDIVAEQMMIRRTMRSVAIEARVAGGAMQFDEAAAAKKIRAASLATGLSQTDLARAIDVYSEKGQGSTAVDNIDRIARQAMAIGTDASVIAKLRAQMGISSKIAGKELNEDEKDQLVAMMHFTGKTGVFRASDMAAESESLFSRFASSGMDFRTGFTRYLGFINQARSATGSSEMARTSINAVQDAIVKKESKINGLGVVTRTGDGNERDFIDILLDLIQKTGGRGELFNKIIDPSRSGKAISNLVTAYHSTKGGAAGRAAMEALLTGDPSLKNASVAEMDKDAAARIGEGGNQIKIAMEQVRQRLAEAILPALDKLATYAPRMVEKIVSAVDFIERHPIIAMGGATGALAATGAAGAMVSHGLGAALRYGADRMVNTVPRLGPGAAGVARFAGGAVGGVAELVSRATAMPVFVVNMPNGGIAGLGAGGSGGRPALLGGGGAAAGSVGGATLEALGGALGSIVLPVVGGALAGYLIANVAQDAMSKTGPFDPRTPGMKADETIGRYHASTAAKIAKELTEGDADPLERELLADMLGKGKNDPTVDALVGRRGDVFGDKPTDFGMSRRFDRIVGNMIGDATFLPATTRAAVSGAQTRQQMSEYLAAQDEPSFGEKMIGALSSPGKPGGEAEMKKALDLSIASEKLVTSTKNATEQLDKLNAVLARINANSSALKMPGPR